MLLGIGPEGHTASLFPGSKTLLEKKHTVAAPWVEKFRTFRITMTPPVIATACEVMVLAAGRGKAEVVARTLGSEKRPTYELPIRLVRARAGRTLWLLDRAAGGELEKARDSAKK